MASLKYTDINEYNTLYDKYNQYISESLPLERIRDIISDVLKDYSEYIIPLSNQKVDITTIIEAAKEGKRVINGMNDEELKAWEEKTIKENGERNQIAFPYTYDPNNQTEAYLEDKPHTR